ncbi:DUF934 domain-containing protein [Acuticoccus sp. I52.16.1]|uniref:DUF934 domain-containing protein n=1 Tax=Acuticoccus sp. I52.16.1 TaxID=2928472 RepID=UPI001FD0E6A7|nr:DUF934 domain-containing protein [Acuticoccus sp. I52.16.1]UOM34696.1 DUF934 domain-containing protein [Acuticoccus sp. I52.16.1]
MWLLDHEGGLARHDTIELGLELAGDDVPQTLPIEPTVTVRLGGYADGRGFSVGNSLRAKGYQGRLIAAGPLVPDQARHAFQSGFDAVAIEDSEMERQGEAAWANAMSLTVRELYMPRRGSRGPEHGIWAARHGQ